MPTPTSKSVVHDEFVRHVECVRAHAENLADAVELGAQRLWSKLPGGYQAAPDDVPGTTPAFSRDGIGSAYVSAYDPKAPGTVGDAVAMSIQTAYVSARERAWRTARAGQVRCEAHAAARRRGHGLPAGPVVSGTVRYVQDVVARAAAGG